MPSSTADVVVVGAGVIGCAIARELALGGARVTLVDRAEPGSEASAAAAGMLGPQAECDAPGPVLALGLTSRGLYPAVVQALLEETGIDPELQRDGIVYVALDDQEAETLERRATWQARAGHRVERLSAADVRRLEPRLPSEIRMGLLFPDDYRIDNVRLTRAYALACLRRGVRVRAGFPVSRVVREHGRAVGVAGGDEVIAAGAVVVAAGAWTRALAPQLPIRPVRGQMLALAASGPPFEHAIYSRGVYLVPRRDGRVLAGSTYEEAGFDKRVTGEALGGILARALHLAPVLRDATFREAWAGLRPGTPDNVPVLGADPDVAALFHASGHYRSGILLAPITARVMRALVAGETSPVDIDALTPARFASPVPA